MPPKRGYNITYKRGPTRTHTITCPDCGFSFTYGPRKTIRKKKSAKRVARGRELAATLERDEKGRFRPRDPRIKRFEEGPSLPKAKRTKGKERFGPRDFGEEI